VEKLDEQCPEAIDKVGPVARVLCDPRDCAPQSANEEEIEINVDAIKPKTFHELDRYLRQCTTVVGAKKKKKSVDAAEPKAKKAKQ